MTHNLWAISWPQSPSCALCRVKHKGPGTSISHCQGLLLNVCSSSQRSTWRPYFGGFLADWACLIGGVSPAREITLIGCSGERISAWKKETEKEFVAVVATILPHLASFLLVRNGCMNESGIKTFCLIVTTVTASVRSCTSFHSGAEHASQLAHETQHLKATDQPAEFNKVEARTLRTTK